MTTRNEELPPPPGADSEVLLLFSCVSFNGAAGGLVDTRDGPAAVASGDVAVAASGPTNSNAGNEKGETSSDSKRLCPILLLKNSFGVGPPGCLLSSLLHIDIFVTLLPYDTKLDHLNFAMHSGPLFPCLSTKNGRVNSTSTASAKPDTRSIGATGLTLFEFVCA
jgi:hypothetical protein